MPQEAAPTRNWRLYLVQHAHADFGYTAPQHQMLPAHLRFIDLALDLCDATDDYPDDAQFRWTCETTWAVREYIRRRPARQIDRLRRRIHEGRIELTALFFNMSEITPETGLVASLQALREIQETLGTRISTAMQNDVNGMAWAWPDYFHGCGVRYLTTAVHGFRSLVPFEIPTLFWWESPSGKRLLAYRPDHYFCGNWLGFHRSNTIGDWVGTAKAQTASPEEAVPKYLADLETKGYPFDRIAAQFSGHETDNSPPSMAQCGIVRAWNESHEWPKVRIATASQFMRDMEELHAGEFPTYRVPWPDWWTDGFGSAARETAASRETHAALQTSASLLSMASMLGAEVPGPTKRRHTEAHEAVLLYDEHTFGSVDSLADPYSTATMVQWEEKSSYIWQAVKDAAMVREETWGILHSLLPRRDCPAITVFNSLGWSRSGFVRAFVEYDLLPQGAAFRLVDEETGHAVPAQPLNDRPHDRPDGHTLAYNHPAGQYLGFWASEVPSFGYKTFAIEVDKGAAAPPRPLTTELPGGILENDFYRIVFDLETAAVASLLDKETGQDLVDPSCPWRFAQFIHEDFPFEPGARHDSGREFKRNAFRRTPLKNPYIVHVADTPLWQAVQFAGDIPGCSTPNGVHIDIRLSKTDKRIEFLFTTRKQAVTTPEALYVAFPFAPRDGALLYEAQGGVAQPARKQLPKTASDWHPIQSFIAVRGDQHQTILASPDVPLAQFGDLNLGKWLHQPQIERPHVFSWLMNNYWWTNFRAAQEGEWTCSFALTSGPDRTNTAATRFGWNAAVPLAPRVSPAAAPNQRPAAGSLLRLDAENLLMVQARPSAYNDAIVIQLRELEGRETAFQLDSPACPGLALWWEEVNAIEEPIPSTEDPLSVGPFEVKFLKSSRPRQHQEDR